MKLPTAKNIHIDSYSSGLSRIVNSTNLIKLSQNETPLGPCSEVSKIIKKSLINVSRYPDGNSSLLREKISKKFKLGRDYPHPIVKHEEARVKALNAFKKVCEHLRNTKR